MKLLDVAAIYVILIIGGFSFTMGAVWADAPSPVQWGLTAIVSVLAWTLGLAAARLLRL